MFITIFTDCISTWLPVVSKILQNIIIFIAWCTHITLFFIYSACILDNFQDSNLRFRIKSKVQLWPLIKNYPLKSHSCPTVWAHSNSVIRSVMGKLYYCYDPHYEMGVADVVWGHISYQNFKFSWQKKQWHDFRKHRALKN